MIKRFNNLYDYRCDELGIPYNVILNNESLESGVINLRNRDADTEVSHLNIFLIKILLF
jgi:glycyl-tRNA synthetase (class II)